MGRWDFDTQEEYSDYMNNKEALPKYEPTSLSSAVTASVFSVLSAVMFWPKGTRAEHKARLSSNHDGVRTELGEQTIHFDAEAETSGWAHGKSPHLPK